MSAASIMSELSNGANDDSSSDGGDDADDANQEDTQINLNDTPVKVVKKLRTGSMDTTGTASSKNSMAAKFHRRLSNMAASSKNAAQMPKFGIRKSIDLTGDQLETYGTKEARPSATGAVTTSVAQQPQLPPEPVEELPLTVVMETILKAADVAHNLQAWDNMVKFANRLYLELRKAHVTGRGDGEFIVAFTDVFDDVLTDETHNGLFSST